MSFADAPPRLRMFAGPNGSGKSTIKSKISKRLLGVFINPDEIEAEIKQNGFLDFQKFDINPSPNETVEFFQNSTFLLKANLLTETKKLVFTENRLDFSNVRVNSYFASVAADFIRRNLMQAKKSFSFETVMSSSDKIDFLRNCRAQGYRNYLYYVATDDPLVNVSRVEQRVKDGGHDVPKNKIESRYYRSLDLLWEAIKLTNRAYIFDNSLESALFIAEITDAETIEIKQDNNLVWFKKYILDKI